MTTQDENQQDKPDADKPDALGTIYVVDDDENVRETLRRLLENAFYHVELFETGESFVSGYDPKAIAVLLLDIHMPGMSGLDVQEYLNARKSDLPIIFITNSGTVKTAVTAIKKGAVDFLEKPFDLANVKSLVERMLVEARRRRAASEQQSFNEALLGKLSWREQQVLERIVAGRLNKQIASDLGISMKTVEARRASIMKKTGSGSVADLMRIVLGTAASSQNRIY